MVILESSSRHIEGCGRPGTLPVSGPEATAIGAPANDNVEAPVCDYARAVEDYAAVGIAAVPTRLDDCKVPLVKAPARIGIRAAHELAGKYPEANVGFYCGPRSRITVVDIDSPCTGELHWAREAFGDTPVIVRTASGKFHCYYRHAGEPTLIRGIANRPIDILGPKRLCVLPPSVRAGFGQYDFIEGGLVDFKALPTLRDGALEGITGRVTEPLTSSNRRGALAAVEVAPGLVPKGERNNQLFLFGLEPARSLDAYEALVDALAGENRKRMVPPLDHAEVCKIAKSLWNLKTNDDLWAKGGQRVRLVMPKLWPLFQAGDSDALMLHALLASKHWHPRGKVFAVAPRAMVLSKVLGDWSARKYRQARRRLCELGILIEVHRGGNRPRDPSLFKFADGAIH